MSQIKQGTLVGTWLSMVFAIFLSNDFLSTCVNIADLPEMVNNNIWVLFYLMNKKLIMIQNNVQLCKF